MATLQAIRVVREEEGRSQSPKSPEARLGMKVEDLWDVIHQQGAQLSPTEKLNACFEGIPLSAFPQCPSSQGNTNSPSLYVSNIELASMPEVFLPGLESKSILQHRIYAVSVVAHLVYMYFLMDNSPSLLMDRRTS